MAMRRWPKRCRNAEVKYRLPSFGVDVEIVRRGSQDKKRGREHGM
jgi:hypothetical protein